MPLSLILQLIVFVAMLATGQMLFKQAALTSAPLNNLAGLLSLLSGPWFWGAIALYGLSTFLWVYILQQIKLSAAYPFSAAAFVIIPLAAALLYGETLTPTYAAGAALIVAGIIVIARSA